MSTARTQSWVQVYLFTEMTNMACKIAREVYLLSLWVALWLATQLPTVPACRQGHTPAIGARAESLLRPRSLGIGEFSGQNEQRAPVQWSRE